jgi:hypothetical protein
MAEIIDVNAASLRAQFSLMKISKQARTLGCEKLTLGPGRRRWRVARSRFTSFSSPTKKSGP